jgi:hypothetical protein
MAWAEWNCLGPNGLGRMELPRAEWPGPNGPGRMAWAEWSSFIYAMFRIKEIKRTFRGANSRGSGTLSA